MKNKEIVGGFNVDWLLNYLMKYKELSVAVQWRFGCWKFNGNSNGIIHDFDGSARDFDGWNSKGLIHEFDGYEMEIARWIFYGNNLGFQCCI